jgi:hypothetical protein
MHKVVYKKCSQSGIFTRNNCGIDLQEVTFTVAAGVYSAVSQIDTDNPAQQMDVNGQVLRILMETALILLRNRYDKCNFFYQKIIVN